MLQYHIIYLIHHILPIGKHYFKYMLVIKIVYGNEVKATSIRYGYGAFMFGEPGNANEIYNNKIFGLLGDTFTDHHKLSK